MSCIPHWQLRSWGCTCCSFSGSYLVPRSRVVVPLRAGIAPYQDGFLLHYLDVLVYPNIPPGLLTGIGVAACIINVGIYARRFQRREIVGW